MKNISVSKIFLLLSTLFVLSACPLTQQLPEKDCATENCIDDISDANADQALGQNGRSNARTVFVHLFEWKWLDIAKECKDVLGPKGYSAVQVSPPNEHAVVWGNPWYERYQPVSYKIESRSGTEEEFRFMVKECKDAGVGIYVDAVINHMTGVVPENEEKRGIAGTRYGHYWYENVYSSWDFHQCTEHDDHNIRNYSNRNEVQMCELVDLADLATDTQYVQQTIANYMNHLIEIGVAGFRIDAAKHMNTFDIQAIKGLLNGNPYIFQEVIDQGGEAISASEYIQNGDVTEFKYSLSLSHAFFSGNISHLLDTPRLGQAWGYLHSDDAVVFVDNHDNQRGHGGGGHILTHKEPAKYTLANIFMLAWPYGYPKVMSSFNFEDPNGSPPADYDGNTKRLYGNQGMGCVSGDPTSESEEAWICEHQWSAISNMVDFRNQSNDAFYINNQWQGDNQIAFGRGNKAFVVINNRDNFMQQWFETGLAEGDYCNVIAGTYDQDGNYCSHNSTVHVDQNGYFEARVAEFSAIALHVGAKIQ